MPTAPAMTHAERMDHKYRYTRHIFDVTRRYFLFGRDNTIASIPARQGDVIVEIGCGTGRNMPIIARRFAECRIVGFDISAEMLKSATKRVRRQRLEGRVELRLGDAEALSPAMFAGIDGNIHLLMSYSISMVPNWRQALAGAIRIIADKGSLSIVDFGDFSGFPNWLARICIKGLGRYGAPPCLSLTSEIQALTDAKEFCFSAHLSAFGWYRVVQVKAKGRPRLC